MTATGSVALAGWPRQVYYGWWVVTAGTAINAISTLPNLGAPIVAGWVYDRAGSYAPALLALSLFTLGSAVMFGITHKPVRGGALVPA